MASEREGAGGGGGGAIIMLSEAAVRNHGGWPQVPT